MPLTPLTDWFPVRVKASLSAEQTDLLWLLFIRGSVAQTLTDTSCLTGAKSFNKGEHPPSGSHAELQNIFHV